jgi:hypothetical protein
MSILLILLIGTGVAVLIAIKSVTKPRGRTELFSTWLIKR